MGGGEGQEEVEGGVLNLGINPSVHHRNRDGDWGRKSVPAQRRNTLNEKI